MCLSKHQLPNSDQKFGSYLPVVVSETYLAESLQFFFETCNDFICEHFLLEVVYSNTNNFE